MGTSPELAAESAAPPLETSEDTISRLRDLPVFVHLGDDRLAPIASCLRRERFAEDELIFSAGEPCKGLYLVESGKVTLFSNTVGRPTRRIAHVGAGELFGELELLENSDRAASARALEPTTLLLLSRDDFARLIAPNPGLVLRFTLLALSRFSDSIERILTPRCRTEPRVYIGRIVRLEWGAGASRHVSLENLSIGGMCLRGLSSPPGPDEPVGGTLRLIDGTELMRFAGRVVWRSHRAVGISFTNSDPGHAERIRRALRRVLVSQSGGGSAGHR